MILVKNLKYLSRFFFFTIGLDRLLDDVLDRKESFIDYKIKFFTWLKNWHFCKGVNPSFC